MAKVHRSSFSKTLCHHSNLRVKYRHLSSKGCPSYDDISYHMMWCHHRVAPPSCFRFSFTIWATAAFCVLGWGIAGKMLGWGWWANLHIRWCQIMSWKDFFDNFEIISIFFLFVFLSSIFIDDGVSRECSDVQGLFQNPLHLSVAEKLANGVEICWPGKSVRWHISITHLVQIHILSLMFDICDRSHSCKSHKYPPAPTHYLNIWRRDDPLGKRNLTL